MRYGVEEVLDNSFRMLAEGELKKAMGRIEACLDWEGVNTVSSEFLSRKIVEVWLDWLKQMPGR